MINRDDFDDDTNFLSNIFKGLKQMSKLKLIIIGTVVITVVVTIGIITVSKNNNVMNDADIPVIAADNSPTHIKPDDAGGMQIPNKDSTIFEAIGNNNETNGKIENLLEDGEEPMKKEEIFSEDTDTAVVNNETVESNYENVEVVTDNSVKEPESTIEKTEIKKEEPIKEKEKPIEKIEAKKADIISTLKSEVGTDKKEMPKATGTRYIQLAAVKSDAEAKTKWAQLQKKYAVLKSMSYRVQKADLGEKGVFYRVQAGPVSTDDANSACASIKAAKGDCLLVK